jgi:phage recombination protein Bet
LNAVTTILEPNREAEAIRVLGNSLYPGAKPESIALVLAYCRMNGLDPMLKPVHIVPTSIKMPNGRYETRDVLMPGIADYRIKAARSGEYGGKSEPEFGPDVIATVGGERVTYPAWCRITIKRIVQGQAREFTANERWLENYATAGRETEAPNKMWKKRAYGQLAKCAESQALRMAFPEFSSGYTAEEMEGKTVVEFNGTTLDHSPGAAAAAPPDAIPERVMNGGPKPANGKRSVQDGINDIRAELATATDVQTVVEIGDSPRVKKAMAYLLAKGEEKTEAGVETRAALEARAAFNELNAMLAEAFDRVKDTPPGPDPGAADDVFPGDRP